MLTTKITQNEALRNGDLTLRGQTVTVVSTERAMGSSDINPRYVYKCVTKSGRTINLIRSGAVKVDDDKPAASKRIAQGKQPIGAEAIKILRGLSFPA